MEQRSHCLTWRNPRWPPPHPDRWHKVRLSVTQRGQDQSGYGHGTKKSLSFQEVCEGGLIGGKEGKERGSPSRWSDSLEGHHWVEQVGISLIQNTKEKCMLGVKTRDGS